MTDAQLIFLLEKKFSDSRIQIVVFNEVGDMRVTFFDSGGNFHNQTLKADGTLQTEL